MEQNPIQNQLLSSASRVYSSLSVIWELMNFSVAWNRCSKRGSDTGGSLWIETIGAAVAADNIFAELGPYSSSCSKLGIFDGEAILCLYSLKVTALLMDWAFW